MNWQLALSEIRACRLELSRLDPRRGMPIQPPSGASAVAVAAVERKLQRALPPSYRSFLLAHDGMPQIYQGVSLLNTYHLARGSYVDLCRLVLDFGEAPRSRAAARLDPPSILPFGVDADAEAIFAWDLSAPREDGEYEVIVFVNEIADRVDDFPSLLALVLDMLRSEVDERQRERDEARGLGPRSQPRSRRAPIRIDLDSIPSTRREGVSSRSCAA